MIRTMITAGSRDGKLYILTAAALICAAVFHLPVLSGGLMDVTSCIRDWGMLCILLLINIHDTDHRIIPNSCILAVLLLAVCYQAPMDLISHLLSVALISTLLLLTVGLARLLRFKTIRFLGGGDIKLLLVLGLFLSPKQSLCMLLLAGLFGLLSALASFLRREKNFPFGPGICAAAAISLLICHG